MTHQEIDIEEFRKKLKKAKELKKVFEKLIKEEDDSGELRLIDFLLLSELSSVSNKLSWLLRGFMIFSGVVITLLVAILTAVL